MVSQSHEFDINKCICLVPPFGERDVDKYFTLFEHVANTLKRPTHVWPLLLQCVHLQGSRSQQYASLSTEFSLDYDKIKAAVLRT